MIYLWICILKYIGFVSAVILRSMLIIYQVNHQAQFLHIKTFGRRIIYYTSYSMVYNAIDLNSTL